MTSAAIVQTTAKEGLSIVAITDHNEISNVESALEAARGGNVLAGADGAEERARAKPDSHFDFFASCLGCIS